MFTNLYLRVMSTTASLQMTELFKLSVGDAHLLRLSQFYSPFPLETQPRAIVVAGKNGKEHDNHEPDSGEDSDAETVKNEEQEKWIKRKKTSDKERVAAEFFDSMARHAARPGSRNQVKAYFGEGCHEIPQNPEPWDHNWVPQEHWDHACHSKQQLLTHYFRHVPYHVRKKLQLDEYSSVVCTPVTCSYHLAICIEMELYKCGIRPEDAIIGDCTAGVGGLTNVLAQKFKKVVAVEYDRDRFEMLRYNLSLILPSIHQGTERVECVWGDSTRELKCLNKCHVLVFSPTWDVPAWYNGDPVNNIFMGSGESRKSLRDVVMEKWKARNKTNLQVIISHIPSTYSCSQDSAEYKDCNFVRYNYTKTVKTMLSPKKNILQFQKMLESAIPGLGPDDTVESKETVEMSPETLPETSGFCLGSMINASYYLGTGPGHPDYDAEYIESLANGTFGNWGKHRGGNRRGDGEYDRKGDRVKGGGRPRNDQAGKGGSRRQGPTHYEQWKMSDSQGDNKGGVSIQQFSDNQKRLAGLMGVAVQARGFGWDSGETKRNYSNEPNAEQTNKKKWNVEETFTNVVETMTAESQKEADKIRERIVEDEKKKDQRAKERAEREKAERQGYEADKQKREAELQRREAELKRRGAEIQKREAEKDDKKEPKTTEDEKREAKILEDYNNDVKKLEDDKVRERNNQINHDLKKQRQKEAAEEADRRFEERRRVDEIKAAEKLTVSELYEDTMCVCLVHAPGIQSIRMICREIKEKTLPSGSFLRYLAGWDGISVVETTVSSLLEEHGTDTDQFYIDFFKPMSFAITRAFFRIGIDPKFRESLRIHSIPVPLDEDEYEYKDFQVEIFCRSEYQDDDVIKPFRKEWHERYWQNRASDLRAARKAHMEETERDIETVEEYIHDRESREKQRKENKEIKRAKEEKSRKQAQLAYAKAADRLQNEWDRCASECLNYDAAIIDEEKLYDNVTAAIMDLRKQFSKVAGRKWKGEEDFDYIEEIEEEQIDTEEEYEMRELRNELRVEITEAMKERRKIQDNINGYKAQIAEMGSYMKDLEHSGAVRTSRSDTNPNREEVERGDNRGDDGRAKGGAKGGAKGPAKGSPNGNPGGKSVSKREQARIDNAKRAMEDREDEERLRFENDKLRAAGHPLLPKDFYKKLREQERAKERRGGKKQ